MLQSTINRYFLKINILKYSGIQTKNLYQCVTCVTTKQIYIKNSHQFWQWQWNNFLN